MERTFAAGSPLHRLAERASVFLGLSGLARFALPGDDHGPDAQLVEVVIDFLLAVAASAVTVRGRRPLRLITRSIAGASCGASAGLPWCSL